VNQTFEGQILGGVILARFRGSSFATNRSHFKKRLIFVPKVDWVAQLNAN